MQGNHFVHHLHVTGTLAANVTDIFTVPADCQLEHASAVGTNASNAQVKLGTTSDDDAYLALADIGDSSVPAEFDRDNFTGGEYPHLAQGTVVQVTVDFDGAGGTAVQNLTVALTFSEG